MSTLAPINLKNRDLVIVGIGDSHLNGQITFAAASDGSTDQVFNVNEGSALDFVWNGSGGVNSYFRADSQINSLSGTRDFYAGLGTGTASMMNFFPRVLRESYSSPRKITIANLGIGGTSWYTWNGEQAAGYFYGTANASNGDTVTVDGVVYTFKTSVSTAFDVLIGGSANATLTNLSYAINLEGGTAGTNYGTGTTQHTTCWVPTLAQLPYMNVNAITEGTVGNSIALSCSATNRITVLNSALTAVSTYNLYAGSNTSAIYTNGKTAISGIGAASSAGVVDAIVVTLGTNDSLHAGYRGRGSSAACTSFLAKLHTDFPAAKIIISTGAAVSNGYLSTINTNVSAIATANSSFASFADMFSIGAGAGNVNIVNPVSGIHCTNYGYKIWATLLMSAVGRALRLS